MGLASNNGESYHKGVDLLLIISILLLSCHHFWFDISLFSNYVWLSEFLKKFLGKLNDKYHLFNNPFTSKLIIFALLVFHGLGSKGTFKSSITVEKVKKTVFIGFFIFFGSTFLLYYPLNISNVGNHLLYIFTTVTGVFFLIKGLQYASRLFLGNLNDDIFNEENETFPQNEKYVENEYSIHFRTQYYFKKKWHQGWINIINPMRSVMVLGTPGSGKSFAVLIPAIWQSIWKGYTAYVYDFKYPDLTLEAYNAYRHTLAENPYAWGKKGNGEPLIPQFFVINFDDIERSHRCNPLFPDSMTDIMDAYEAAQTIMLNLNRTWVQKQGDFFVESAINFLTAVIWYLRSASVKYKNLHQIETQKPEIEQDTNALNRYKQLSQVCTFPHVIEFVNEDYGSMFEIMSKYQDLEVYVKPFKDAWQDGAIEQLAGQIASVRIPITRISSPTIYWIMTGNDLSLDINNPDSPKILCTGNNPERIGIYGTVFSLYTSRMLKMVNKKGRLKSALFWDELPTMFIKGIDTLIATARSNKVAPWLGFQDFEQLTRDYGDKEAKVIMNTVGNFFSGVVVFNSAETLSKRFGKTNQLKESITFSRTDTSLNLQTQQQDVIPPSKIAPLKQGEFVGQTVDNFGEEVDLKTFKGQILIDKTLTKKHKQLPPIKDFEQFAIKMGYSQGYATQSESTKRLIREHLTSSCYQKVKQDVRELVENEAISFGISINKRNGISNSSKK